MDPIQIGTQVTALRDGVPHAGIVSKVNPDGTFSLRLQDGTFLHQVGPEESVIE